MGFSGFGSSECRVGAASRRRVVLLCLCLCSAMATQVWADAMPHTLIYSGNLDSELEPCGCSEVGNSGGLKRRATLLKQLRLERPQLVVVSSGGLTKVVPGFSPTKHHFIRSGMGLLNYDAIGIQWADLAEGVELAREARLPWVASNWRNDDFVRQRLIERETYQAVYLQWLDPAKSPYREMAQAQDPVHDDISWLKQQLVKARRAGRLTLLGTTYDLTQAEAKLPLADVDILLLESAYEVYAEPKNVGTTLVLQAGSRGMRLGRLDFELKNGRINRWQHQVLAMPPEMPDAPEMDGWYQAYNVAVKEDYKRIIQKLKTKPQQQSPYAGAEACAACHPAASGRWLGSEHAKAFHTLQRVQKDFDQECISCHVVGWNTEGGFVDLKTTAKLAHVQCESCHGPRAAHVQSGGQQRASTSAGSAVCAQCHNAAHSPEFDFDQYWPKIAH